LARHPAQVRAETRITDFDFMQNTPAQSLGRYLITPLTRLTDSGQYAASVSIRRGMHDRIFRLIPRFDSAANAERYALAQGQHFVLNNQLA
jgi:hypothetical protein